MTKISAGSYDLNKWLAGGYEEDVVTVIYGGAASGKTNFCLMAAVSAAKKGNKVIYVDTEGGFSVERVKQIIGKVNGEGKEKMNEDIEIPENLVKFSSGISNRHSLKKSNLTHENVYINKVMENILLLKPTNFLEQKKVFDRLAKHLENEASLIIVDSMTIHYRIELGDAREKNVEQPGEIQKTNSELARQIGILGEITRKKNIPIIVTNQTYNWEDDIKMVGGDILKYWGKCIIELTNEKGSRTAFLRKHRSLPEKSLGFVIYDGGIRKKGWI